VRNEEATRHWVPVAYFQSLLAHGLSGRLCLGQLRSTFGVDTDELAFLAFILKSDEALDKREQSVVFTAPDVVARLPLGATLTRQNITAEYVLAAEFL
jgi:hypothetical protein